ncbi:hypothetical protein [Chitinophaga cymbidii]|uniref:DUF4595 domain-containing protein n=1 Tax=Chitinophaga cymbidii TaxID=1096750 RepID=A0A512RJI3_9BACT|nr:hypothetical protein [Chitinophaga cymbidii]GEP95844.1 hypothetical protein CCY01nite_21040 [Chitinophaga cymbidii]
MKSLYCFGACILLLAGCIKDPQMPAPDTEPPAKPDWLLESISVIDAISETPIFGGPMRYYKWYHEFEYDENYKPRIRREFYGAEDTVNLALLMVDTLHYDEQLRVKEAVTWSQRSGRVTVGKKFSYNGTDTLPATYENYGYTYPDTTNFTLQYRLSFIYDNASVRQIYANPKGGFDTTVNVYLTGNYTHSISPSGVRTDHYFAYDNAPNVEQFLNIDNGLIFLMPEAVAQLPRMSLNNWTERWDYIYGSRDRSLTYNEAGLLSSTLTINYDAVTKYMVRYTYRAVE